MPKWGKIIHANRLARLEPAPRGAGAHGHAGKQRVGDVSRKEHVTNSKGASSSISRGIRDCLQHSVTDKATALLDHLSALKKRTILKEFQIICFRSDRL